MAASSRDSISQRLSLDGDDEVKRKLGEIGAKGETEFAKLGAASMAASVGLARFATTASGAIAPLGTSFANLTTKVGNLGSAVSGILPNISGLTAALGISVTAFGAFALAKEAAFSIDELKDEAANLGLTTDQLQAFRLLSAESGGDVHKFETAISKMNIAVANAAANLKGFNISATGGVDVIRGSALTASGATEVLKGGVDGMARSIEHGVTVLRAAGPAIDLAGDALHTLGFTASEVARLFKLDTFERMKIIAPRLLDIKFSALQAKLATDIFGKGWRDLLPAVSDGAEGISDALRRVKELNVGLTEADLSFSAGFMKHFAEFQLVGGTALRIIGELVGSVLGPAFTALTASMSQNLPALRRWADEVGKGAVPVVNDLIAVIQNLARSPDAQQPIKTDWVRDAVASIQSLRESFDAAASALGSMADSAASAINGVFGTEFSGRGLAIALAVGKMSGAFDLLLPAVVAVAAVIAALASPAGLLLLVAGIAALDVKLLASGNAWDLYKGNVQASWDLLKSFAVYLGGAFLSALQAAADFIKSVFEAPLNWLTDKFNTLKSAFGDLTSSATSSSGALVPGATIGGFARGGFVPGSGTGDTVPAWLTPGEVVHSRRTVSVLGADLLLAMNAFPERFRNLFHGFNRGGMVAGLGASLMPAQRFATGGLVAAAAGGGAARSEFTIVIGGERFSASSDRAIANSLLRTAMRERLTMAGRKPSSVGG